MNHPEALHIPRPWLLHAFSLDMLGRDVAPVQLRVTAVEDLPRQADYRIAVGQECVARLIADHLGVPMAWHDYLSPCGVKLFPGDVAYVARYRGPWPAISNGEMEILGKLDFWRVEVLPS